jgi:1-acyl-sn-glycerol-3-phosphate acyltransferase
MTWLYIIGYLPVWLVFHTLWRVRTKRLAQIPEGPVVLCCNHLHALDPVALAMITRRQIHYMSKKELLKGFGGWVIKNLGAYPVDRFGNDVKSMRHTLKLLGKGKIVGIFPEGHRNADDLVHEFHPGAAMFALRTKASLVPVGIHSRYKPFARIQFVVGEALDLSEYKDKRIGSEDIRVVNERLHARVSELAAMARDLS